MPRCFTSLLALAALAISSTVGCSNETESPDGGNTIAKDEPKAETPASSTSDSMKHVEALRHDVAVPAAPATTPTHDPDPTSQCNAITPIASTIPVRVRFSDEAAPSLDEADVPNGTYVFIHGDIFNADRQRDNFMLPASTLVVGDRSFEEVISDTNVTVRTLGRLDSRSGGKVHLSCVFPAVTDPAATQDIAFYSKDADELTLERPYEGGGVLRRVYQRQ